MYILYAIIRLQEVIRALRRCCLLLFNLNGNGSAYAGSQVFEIHVRGKCHKKLLPVLHFIDAMHKFEFSSATIANFMHVLDRKSVV